MRSPHFRDHDPPTLDAWISRFMRLALLRYLPNDDRVALLLNLHIGPHVVLVSESLLYNRI